MPHLNVRHNDHVLEINTEHIEVTSITEPDPAWRYVDAAGHLHVAWTDRGGVISYPTLERVHGDEELDVDGDPWRPSWWVCPQCEERITPGMRSGMTRWIPGLTSYEIDGKPVSPEEARAFADEWQRSLNVRANDPALKSFKEGYL